jgi:hypothetical protein
VSFKRLLPLCLVAIVGCKSVTQPTPTVIPGPAPVSVLTYHNDNARTGANTNETILTVAGVSGTNFGLLYSYPVDGYVFAQPLYLDGRTSDTSGKRPALYYGASRDYLKCFSITNGAISRVVSKSGLVFDNPGGTTSVSADGTTNAIVWIIQSGSWPAGHAVLWAYDALDLSRDLYNSGDILPPPVKFSVPTVCNGKVFVGTQTAVCVFGIR